MSLLKLTGALLALALLGGCAAPKTIDYTAYKQARPKSILVLPPINESPEVQASYSLVSQVTYPLAEAGYYVLPIALVDETFRQNGLTTANDIQAWHRPSCTTSLVRTRRCTSPLPITAPSTC